MFVSATACSGEQAPPNLGAYLDGRGAAYDTYVTNAVAMLNKRNLDAARKDLAMAIDSPRNEEPNYEPFILLAKVECAAGNFSEAEELMDDARCALSVESGQLSCPKIPDEDGFVTQGGTSRCYKTMCGEMLEGYYPAKSPKQVARVGTLKNELAGAEVQCGQNHQAGQGDPERKR